MAFLRILMDISIFSVITTIQEPTPALRALQNRLKQVGGWLVVAGDAKGPSQWGLPDSDFLSLDDQSASGFSLPSDACGPWASAWCFMRRKFLAAQRTQPDERFRG